MALLSDICPDIEQVSIDECYMDYTSVSNRFVSPIEAAALIRGHVREQLGFTVNVGISDKKLWPLPVSSFIQGKKRGASNISAQKKFQLEKAIDAIRQRYGADAIVRGSLIKKNEQSK